VKAFHVAKINWRNDDVNSLALFKNGLAITFDGAPDLRALNGGSFIVTLEPLPKTTPGIVAIASPRNIFVLDGDVSAVDATTVVWKVSLLPEKWLLTFQEIRVRVRLMGYKIWSLAGDQTLYLDGQAFGKPSLRADKKTPCTDLIYPSGNGARASDFESWFYLGVPAPIPPTPVPTPAPPIVGPILTPTPTPTPTAAPTPEEPTPPLRRRRRRREPQ
jgi:hypothetical protein